MNRRVLLVVASLAIVAFAGGAYAASQSSAPNVRQAFLNDVAHRLNVSPAQLRAAIRGAFLDQLNTAVATGRLTRVQANALRGWVQRTGVVPLRALLGPGPLGRAPFAAAAPFKQAVLFGGLLESADYLGITPMRLVSQLRAGKSLAQIAAAHGKSAAGLKAALIGRAQQMINRLVAANVISAARGNRLLARLSAKIDKLLTRTNFRFFEFAGPGGPGAPRPFAGPIGPGIAPPVPIP